MNTRNIIEKLGGVCALASQIDYPITTVMNWVTRGRIPMKHFKVIIKAAKEQGVDIDVIDLVSASTKKVKR